MALTKKPTKFCSENDMLTCTEKTIYSLETLYYKCSVENNLNSIKCSKTETGCLQTQKTLHREHWYFVFWVHI